MGPKLRYPTVLVLAWLDSCVLPQTRLFSIRFLRRLVLQMFLEKAVIDHTATELAGIAPMTPMGVFVCESMMKKYGLPALADAHIS